MPENMTSLFVLGLLVVATPSVMVAVLGIAALLNRQLPERTIGNVCRAGTVTAFLSALAVTVLMITHDTRHVVLDLGDWVAIEYHGELPGPEQPHYHFAVRFVFDRLSVPFVILSLTLCGTIGAFAVKYMHREPGYNRFFMLYAIFVLGMVMASLAGTIETLFAGWELVGLSSALLIAFFHERPAPCQNGLRVWIVYRVSDAALLVAAVVMHHLRGEGDLGRLLGTDPSHPWPEGHALVAGGEAFLVGLLLVIAAAGKSALVPFSGWLPRAMEGPTPSSAVFYGAVSVHLGAYLLLRVSPLLEASPPLAILVIALGLATAVYAHLAGSVQTDIKSALSFASLVQVGLIVAEIGLGSWFPFLWYLALIHLIGHASLRTLQLIRAPSLLQDYRALENAIGGRLPSANSGWQTLPSGRAQRWFYRFALERGYLDAWLADYIATPFVRLFKWCERLEQKWTRWLSGESHDCRRPEPQAQPEKVLEPIEGRS